MIVSESRRRYDNRSFELITNAVVRDFDIWAHGVGTNGRKKKDEQCERGELMLRESSLFGRHSRCINWSRLVEKITGEKFILSP